MAISSHTPFAERAAPVSTAHADPAIDAKLNDSPPENDTSCAVPPKSSTDTLPATVGDTENPVELNGDLSTNNEIPTQDALRKIEDYTVLDRDGKLVPFKSIYTGTNVARRVLIIFIRHFFCGNCQEYIRTLTASITPSSLLHLTVPTFIAVIGCGSPALIPMYQTETACPFPIYADPTKRLYSALGMQRTLTLGARPEYQRRGTLMGMLQSVRQGFVALKDGMVFQAGDMHQVGGEFLFEPIDIATPICSPNDEQGAKQLGSATGTENGSLGIRGEEKRITWCHRMRNTRDHAEIPELREVLGLDGEGVPGHDQKRWMKALRERKGTGLSSRTSGSTEMSV